MHLSDIPLSILDLAPVPVGVEPSEALARSTELVGLAEALGYHRYWVAEHHNMPGIASSSPAVLLAHLGAHSGHIRLGSGGVMLPNHAPLSVAEQFGMLACLHPGRIDLGLGRAPGTDPLTAQALRSGLAGDDFPEQFAHLRAFLEQSFPEQHPFSKVRSVPSPSTQPELWLLGSSDFSARMAALLGLPFSFAHHFSHRNTEAAARIYLDSFRPSEALAEPRLMLGVAVVCAPDDQTADRLHSSTRLQMLRLRTGKPSRLPTVEEATGYVMTPMERQIVSDATGGHIFGSPQTVASGLLELAERTGAHELMITTNVHSHQARLASYRLIAEEAKRVQPSR